MRYAKQCLLSLGFTLSFQILLFVVTGIIGGKLEGEEERSISLTLVPLAGTAEPAAVARALGVSIAMNSEDTSLFEIPEIASASHDTQA